MVADLGHPLLLDVLEGRGCDDAVADEEDVRLRVGERAEAVVVFLSGGVEEPECVGIIADHDGHGVVVEDLERAVEMDIAVERGGSQRREEGKKRWKDAW